VVLVACSLSLNATPVVGTLQVVGGRVNVTTTIIDFSPAGGSLGDMTYAGGGATGSFAGVTAGTIGTLQDLPSSLGADNNPVISVGSYFVFNGSQPAILSGSSWVMNYLARPENLWVPPVSWKPGRHGNRIGKPHCFSGFQVLLTC